MHDICISLGTLVERMETFQLILIDFGHLMPIQISLWGRGEPVHREAANKHFIFQNFLKSGMKSSLVWFGASFLDPQT